MRALIEASERAPIYQRVFCPKGEAGRAPLTKAVYERKIFLREQWTEASGRSLRVKDKLKCLGRGAAGAHFPDVD
jgi:hypothetical protein